MSDFQNKIALITGASRGIGAVAARTLAAQGAHVVLVARTVGGLEAVDDLIRADGKGQATLLPMDLEKLLDVDKIGPTIAERFGRLDMLVANAGMLGTLGPLAHANPKEWERVFTVNVHANMRLIRTLDPLLQASKAGRAVFITSSGAEKVRAYWGAYRASKAALQMMAQIYAAETEQTNLRVNILQPGPVDTPMLKAAYPGGYQGDDLRQPEDLMAPLLALLTENCAQHGATVRI